MNLSAVVTFCREASPGFLRCGLPLIGLRCWQQRPTHTKPPSQRFRRSSSSSARKKLRRSMPLLRESSPRTIRPGPMKLAWFTSSIAACRSEEHTSELQSHSDLVCRLLLEKKKKLSTTIISYNKLHYSA